MQSGTDWNKPRMSKRPHVPSCRPLNASVLPQHILILTDSIFWCKCGSEKSSEPSLGKTALKPPCRGTRIHKLSALLSENRYKFSTRRDKRHFTRGETTSSLLFISLVTILYSNCKGFFFFFPLSCAPGCADTTATYTLNSRWQYTIITQECTGCHMGLCSIQLLAGPAEQ